MRKYSDSILDIGALLAEIPLRSDTCVWLKIVWLSLRQDEVQIRPFAASPWCLSMSDFRILIRLQFAFPSLVLLDSDLVWACLDTDMASRVYELKCVISFCLHRLHSLIIILHFLRVSREDGASLGTGHDFVLRLFWRAGGVVLHY